MEADIEENTPDANLASEIAALESMSKHETPKPSVAQKIIAVVGLIIFIAMIPLWLYAFPDEGNLFVPSDVWFCASWIGCGIAGICALVPAH